jgi:hypothetical protein
VTSGPLVLGAYFTAAKPPAVQDPSFIPLMTPVVMFIVFGSSYFHLQS